MSSDQPIDIFDFFIGALALITAITSTILCCRALLPRAQMQIFVEIITQSKEVLRDAGQAGLINESSYKDMAEKIEDLEQCGANLREDIYQAKTLFEEYVSAFKGLSTTAMRLVSQARYLRACIATCTAEAKQTQQRQQHDPIVAQETDLDSITTPPSQMDDPVVLPAHPYGQCPPCLAHSGIQVGLETHTTASCISVWLKRLWRSSSKSNPETLPECPV